MANLTNFDPPRRGLRCSSRSLTRKSNDSASLHARTDDTCSEFSSWLNSISCTRMACKQAGERFIDCESKSSDEIRHVLRNQPPQCLKLLHKSSENHRLHFWEADLALFANEADWFIEHSRKLLANKPHLNSSQQFSKMSRNACYSSKFP